MVAGIGAAEVILPIFERRNSSSLRKAITISLVGCLAFYLFLAAFVSAVHLAMPLAKSEREAMTWLRINTPEDSKVLVVSCMPWYADHSSEWLPVIAERRSQAVVQGYEWLPGFAERIQAHESLQHCGLLGSECLEKWRTEEQIAFSHVYIPTPEALNKDSYEDECGALRLTLKKDDAYSLSFEGEGATILERLSSK
jgi:hypothetical protein